MWQVTLFNWTGFIVLMLILFALLSLLVYWFWNEWLKSLSFMWRVSTIAYIQGCKDKERWKFSFKDKNGKEYKIVEVKENDKTPSVNRKTHL